MKIEEQLEVFKKWIRLNAIEGITLDIDDMIDFGGVLCDENESLKTLVKALEEYKTLKEKQTPKPPTVSIQSEDVKIGKCTFKAGVKLERCTCGSWVMPHWIYCEKCGHRLR